LRDIFLNKATIGKNAAIPIITKSNLALKVEKPKIKKESAAV
jgi:hypothetical protein